MMFDSVGCKGWLSCHILCQSSLIRGHQANYFASAARRNISAVIVMLRFFGALLPSYASYARFRKTSGKTPKVAWTMKPAERRQNGTGCA